MLGSAWDTKSAAISSAREIPSRMEAPRAYFDTNGDGKLTSADAAFAQFKVLVTNADGSTTVMTLAQLGITSIHLTADSTRIELPDGSVIEGQATFKKSDGSTGTVTEAVAARGMTWGGRFARRNKEQTVSGRCATTSRRSTNCMRVSTNFPEGVPAAGGEWWVGTCPTHVAREFVRSL